MLLQDAPENFNSQARRRYHEKWLARKGGFTPNPLIFFNVFRAVLVEVSDQAVVHPVLEEFARKLRDTAEELCQDLLGVSEFSRGCRLCGFLFFFF